MWFGIGQLIVGIVGGLIGVIEADQAWTLVVTGFGTIGLRFKTTSPIE